MSLKEELFSGAIYIAVARYSGLFITIIVSAILSRMLTPQDYGVVALATVMLTFFNLLGDIGIGPAVIQNQTLTQKDMDSINTFNAYQGLILGCLFFLSAPLIAEFYDNDDVLFICRLMSLTIVLNCVNAVPSSILYRNQRFKFITVVSLFTSIVGAVMSVIMAYSGYGAVSLVLPNILISFVLLFIYRRASGVHFVLKIDWSPLKRIFSFSAYQFLANIISYLSRNVDSILVGRYIGIKPLGYYNKSYNLMLMPLQYVSAVLIPVMLPVFSKYQNDLNYIQEKYTQILRFFAFVGIPFCLLLYFCADEIILLFFGNQWGMSIPAFKILAISVPFQIMGCSSGSIFQATGNTKAMFWNGFIGAFFTLGAFALGVMVYGTIEALAWGYTGAMIVTTFICFFIMYRYALKSSFLIYLKSMVAPLIFAIVLGCVLYFSALIPMSGLFLSVCVKSLVGILFSILYIQSLGYYNVFLSLKQIISKIKR